MKKALTIGELLITMAIIGTIALLVLPGFLQDYHKKIYTAKLKKTVEQIEAAIGQACSDNNVSYFYLTPYATISDKSKQQEFLDKYFMRASTNKDDAFASQYKDLKTGTASSNNLNLSAHAWAKLADSQAISFLCYGSQSDGTCVFRVDVNSVDQPNIGGRDFFSLYLDTKTNKLHDNAGAGDCGTGNKGEGCFAKLLEDNWEMKY